MLGVLALLVAIPGDDLLTESDRAGRFFQDPNVFGPFLIPPALILIEEICARGCCRARLATQGARCWRSSLLGVLFSYSRGAWLNLALAWSSCSWLSCSLRGGGRDALRRCCSP